MFHQLWLQRRLQSPLKIDNYESVKVFEQSLARYTTNYLHGDDAPLNTNTLVFNEGSANFNLFKLVPGGAYITHNPMLHLWKGVDIDSNILSIFTSQNNTKYRQCEEPINIGRPYNLFLLQMASTADLKQTVDALKYATEDKRFTVFKTHPATGDGTDFQKLWEAFKRNGLVSDYTELVDGSLEDLIDHADVVYSVDSACTFNAMLKHKPVFNYRVNEFSEIVPVVSTSKNHNISPISEPDLLRFLTWYYHYISININRFNYEQRIEQIVHQFNTGRTIREMFT